jgi:hypothetical protein
MAKAKKVKKLNWLDKMFENEGELVTVEQAKLLAWRAYDRGIQDGAAIVRSGY